MTRLLSSLLVVLILGTGGLAGQSTATLPAAPAAAVESIDRVIADALASHAFAGATVGIASGGQIRLIKGYGQADLENRVPVTEKTVFRIGSVTKQFTAVAILQLAEQGKLSLEDPLSKYRPEFPRAAEVTIRQLLNHTSGIMSYTHPRVMAQMKDAGRREWTPDQLIAKIATLEPQYEFDPGTGWSYSNSAYIILGAIIEKVSGKSYADFLRSEILDPLGLRDTGVDDLGIIVPDRARGYDASKAQPTGFRNAEFIPLSTAGPAGAMRSTAADMLAWHMALFGGKVLKPESLKEMTTPARLKDGRLASKGRVPPIWLPETTEYGLGLFLGNTDGKPTTGHGGAINGFNTWMETFRDQGVTIVVMANTTYPAAENTGPKVAAAWFRGAGVP